MTQIYFKPRKGGFFGFIGSLSIVYILIIVSTILFFVQGILNYINPTFIDYYSLKPADLIAGRYVWTLLTHIFIHANFLHLFVNMFSLFFIGMIVERIIGRKRFFWFYIIAGLFAGIMYTLCAMVGSAYGLTSILGSIIVPAVGASGAVFGLLGILAVLIPTKKVSLIVGPLILIILQVALTPFMPASLQTIFSLIVNVLLVIMIFSMFVYNPKFSKISVPITLPLWLAPIIAIVPLIIVGIFIPLPIGNTAHLGGLIVGLIYGFYLRSKYKKKVEMVQRYFR